MGTNKDAHSMTIWDHLGELRKRVIIILLTVMVAAVICFAYVDDILEFLLKPAPNLQLIFTTPPEALVAQVRLALQAALIVTLPLNLIQVLLFIVPALEETEKKVILPFFLAMNVLFFLGVAFSYYMVIPFAIRFFMGFGTESLTPLFSIGNYISFITSLLLSFGLIFQIPLVFWFLGLIGLVSSAFLRNNRKFAILVIVVVAAIMTPPDVVSQVLMAIPLIFLYEAGMVLVWVTERQKRRTAKV
ncbi:MAG: twin-arginine translocase subunit TatC [Dethiobacteraceae bacterium]|jgi:sec-independent protein translocase protein TatC|nr:twin-arginine translocase subunit TatC [Bacillota bacterium]